MEIALERHFSLLPRAGLMGRRLDKESALDHFLNDVVNEMDSYGLFGNYVNVKRFARVAEILSEWQAERSATGS